jgi:hypothetical protein
MRSSTPSRRIAASIAAGLSLTICSLSLGPWLHAQELGRTSAANSGFLPQATIVDIMSSMVMPAAQLLWDAVSFESGPDGDFVKTPETDAEWELLRWSAVTLAESANVLLIPGRDVDRPDAVSEAPDVELSPAQIKVLIDDGHDAWIGHAHALHEIAMQAITAIDAKDGDQLADVGGTLDTACEGCHLQFWYPSQEQ